MTAGPDTSVPEAIQARVRCAARALGRAGLAHAYGHCSQRLSGDEFLVCAPMPMGLIRQESGIVVPVAGPLPEGVLGEVRIHQQIYQRRPEVGGIVRSMPPATMTLSAAGITPRVRHGMGCYFSPGVPLWDDVQLVRSDAQAAGVAAQLDAGPAIVMRGNGLVTAAATLEKAVVLTWYLEDAARIERDLRSAGLADPAGEIGPEAARLRATDAGRIFERMWDYLCAGDPECL